VNKILNIVKLLAPFAYHDIYLIGCLNLLLIPLLWKPRIRYISDWVDYVLSIPCCESYRLCAYWKLNGFWKHLFEVWLYWLFIFNGWSSMY